MPLHLDHIIWATPDLDSGSDLFARLTGVTPGGGGSHPGFGSRNRLVSLSDSTYLELLAPDPAQDLPGTWGAQVAALNGPQMFSFCLASNDFDETAQAAKAAGFAVEEPQAMSRETAPGNWLRWRIMRLTDPRWPGRLPFFIDWQGAPSPGLSTPKGCQLTDFCALSPDPKPLGALFDAIGCDIPVRGAARFGYAAHLETPAGAVLLT
ncbi:MAG: VOC family protein [Sulfitobacter sp.]|nr:VOC family protein [Sulfitobacter sp.]